ncbi:hypothetical protein VTJ04DRAFT_3733 [Mycothermus thermophilus]|uniref:uncharacterized protein n=1 Tax=Humicola insolens TaxID=85995 RepID=UPI0037443B48
MLFKPSPDVTFCLLLYLPWAQRTRGLTIGMYVQAVNISTPNPSTSQPLNPSSALLFPYQYSPAYFRPSPEPPFCSPFLFNLLLSTLPEVPR